MPKVRGLPKVRFNLENKGGTSYINLVFIYSRGRLKRGTGQTINPKFWDAKEQRAIYDKHHSTKHNQVNDVLNSLAAVVIQIWRDFNLGGISIDDFKNEIDYRMEYKPRPEPEDLQTRPLFDFIENEYLLEMQAKALSTWKALNGAYNHLKEYAAEKRGGRLEYEDLTHRFFADFKKWLHEPPRNHSINTAGKWIKGVKQFAKVAHDRRYHTTTDFRGIKIESARTSKIALSFDELEHLYSLDLADNPRLEKVRDLFLIGCYTGLRFSDFTRIRPEHITTENGQKLLTIVTQKTGEVVTIPLLPIPAALLAKYDYHTPNISNQKMNDYLKELGRLAGMMDKMYVTTTAGGKRQEQVLEKWEKLTTHVARRSFATNFFLAGYDIAILMGITGHKTHPQFMKYIAVDGKVNAMKFAELQKQKAAQPLKAVS